jgi:hypothetical protein
MTERTELQKSAKRVYDALVDVEYEARRMYQHDPSVAQQAQIAVTQLAIEHAFDCVTKLMHEEDGE